MHRPIIGTLLAILLQSAPPQAPALDLSVPTEATPPTPPVLVLDKDDPDLSVAARTYLKQIRRVIDAQIKTNPEPMPAPGLKCEEMAIDYLIVFDGKGNVVDVEIRTDGILDPRGVSKATRDYLLRILRAISPLPAYPETSLASPPLLGIPIQKVTQCGWHLIKQQGPAPNILEGKH